MNNWWNNLTNTERALILGGGLDTYRYLSRTMGDLGAEEPLYDFSGLGVDLDGLGVDLGESMPLYDYSGPQ